jgi:hypothetical protein
MHRRITCVVEYRPPDHLMRKKIWENILFPQIYGERGGLQLAADVDIAAIAIKYELTGGFIKNAVLAALLSGTVYLFSIFNACYHSLSLCVCFSLQPYLGAAQPRSLPSQTS